jgi:signal transduction histidine kinase
MVLAIVATIGAAGLVMYFQYHAITTLQSQTQVIVHQISEQTAADIAGELRRVLAGPVLDTLTAVSQPDLRAGRFDLVAQEYKKGLEAYPHVDRFLAWSTETEATTPGEALFYARDGRFERDPALGRAVFELARRHAPTQHIYVAADGVGPDQQQQVLLRVFWTDAQRLEYFAVLGLVVDPSTMPKHLFAEPQRTKLDALLARRAGDTPLRLRVTDEHGALVYGTANAGTVSGRVEFPMLFYPANEIQARMSGSVAPRPWVIEVGAPDLAGAIAGVSQNYWPTIVSVALMLVALGLTVQAHRRSTELADMQSDFVAHVSHQLKTPLSLLSAATETLQMDRIRSPEKLGEYLDTIRAEAARLSTLVQRVLEFSRVQQQRSYEFEHVDLAALTRETVDAFAHGLSRHHVKCDVRQEGPGPYVRADPAALEQVIANLLDNAVKYSGPIKEITVLVRTERSVAIVEIADCGVGVAPADQARIFERFYRAPSAAHRPGFGLGLPIVRELVHAHGGRVDMTSTPGVGSTFRVSLPRVAAAPVVTPSPALDSPEAAS